MASESRFQDAELRDDKVDVSHEERMHWGALTEEELAIQKKLLFRIDLLIMPMVILVYLMNYIDRYVDIPSHITQIGTTKTFIQEQLRSRAVARS